MKLFLLVIAGLIVLFLVGLYLFQDRLIYLPRSYSKEDPTVNRVDAVRYTSSGKEQHAWLLKRSPDAPVEQIWWVFGGNGSTAWDWVDIVSLVEPSANRVFVLFDYPGYGINQGRPSPKRIHQSVEDALEPVSQKLGLSREDLIARSATIGHSLGSAVALGMAQRHGLKQIIAISPFTTMSAVVDREIGPTLGRLLRHHYNNEESIEALLREVENLDITIYHGNQDQLIPLAMGRSLADRDASGKKIQLVTVKGAGHNDILRQIREPLVEALAEDRK